MDDELFSPTLQERPVSSTPPWRPESIIYPAFFGGPLAAATLGVLNGRRLALPSGALAVIGAAGLAAFAARVVFANALEGNGAIRLAGSLAGVLVWLVIIAQQRRAFRAYSYHGAEPARLIGPGFAAAIGLGLFEAIIVFGVVR